MTQAKFNPFAPATKHEAKLRLALIGPAGSGKTYTALRIAQALGPRVALIDTERGSASKYADAFSFDVVNLDSHHPQQYIAMIQAAQAAGYDVLIIDSLSHAWIGRGGALELVDEAAKKQRSSGGNSNSFSGWRDVTPLHNQLVDAMTGAGLHLIVTMRAKMEYVQEKDEKGKTTIRKVGLQPVQRDGLEYEFDVVADLDADNYFIVGKTRCPALRGVVVQQAGPEIAEALLTWLEGAPIPTCTRCDAIIEATERKGRNELIAFTTEHYGQALCGRCATEAWKEERAKQDNGFAGQAARAAAGQEARAGKQAAYEREASTPRRSMSAFQREKIFELYAGLYPDESAGEGVDELFQRETGHPLADATYDHGRQITAYLLRVKRNQPTSQAEAVQE